MGKIQVLLVDDEKEYVEGLSERMALDGFETTVAFSGKEGLEAIGEEHPDVLVLDLDMPGMGGMEVLERVRRDHPDTQVVILTGHGSATVEEEAREKGAFEFLEKPVDYPGLKSVIDRAWGITKKVTKAVADDLVLTFVGETSLREEALAEQAAPGSGKLASEALKHPSEAVKLPSEGLKVLLVDDNEDYVRTLSERLELRDLDSETAVSGEDALSLMGEEPPDVMVLDLNMPGMGGMEVLKRVKRDHPGTEVIILTGHGSPKEEAEAARLGASHYLNKPVDLRDLVGAVRAAGQKARPEGLRKGAK
jgi:DNA-binding NtrC family response regulator